MARRVTPLSRQNSILLLCDMQEKFRPTIKYFPQIIETSNKLLQACKILDIPYVVTEQYPKGLGRTVPELEIGDTKPFEKTLFSMCTPDVISYIKEQVKGQSSSIEILRELFRRYKLYWSKKKYQKVWIDGHDVMETF